MKPTDYTNQLNQPDNSGHVSEPLQTYTSHSFIHRLFQEAEQTVTQSTTLKTTKPKKKVDQTPKKENKLRSKNKVRYSYD